jgi:hypothetical protein
MDRPISLYAFSIIDADVVTLKKFKQVIPGVRWILADESIRKNTNPKALHQELLGLRR